MNGPLVSVCVTTYNHDKFIADALESILMQKTSFEFEIIVGEDESSDDTRIICQEYEKKYPNKIRLILRSRKDAMMINNKPTGRFNFTETIKAAKGKYIAFLEGDDYWTDPLKLQKQVDILEQNPDCIACHHWHKNTIKNKNGIFEEREAPKRAEDGYLGIQKSDIGKIFSFELRPQSRTLMFRNIFIEQGFPDWFFKIQFGDIGLCFLLGKFGRFYFIDEVMAAYRIHEAGVSSVFKNKEGAIFGNKQWIRLISFALRYYDNSYSNEAYDGIQVFLKRIRNTTNNSIGQRIKLVGFIVNHTVGTFSFKKKLISSLIK